MVSLPLSGVLCETLGWESVFYVFGVLGVIWFIVWVLLVFNGPEDHPTISTEEREYLKVSDGFFLMTTDHGLSRLASRML